MVYWLWRPNGHAFQPCCLSVLLHRHADFSGYVSNRRKPLIFSLAQNEVIKRGFPVNNYRVSRGGPNCILVASQDEVTLAVRKHVSLLLHVATMLRAAKLWSEE